MNCHSHEHWYQINNYYEKMIMWYTATDIIYFLTDNYQK